MASKDENACVSILKTTEGYFLLLNRDDATKVVSIRGWKSLRDAISYYEDGYNAGHNRSHEASMSACINFIQFQPRIIQFPTLDDLVKGLDLTPNEKPLTIRSISGCYLVLKLKSELAEPIYEKGFEPKLITPR